MSVLEIDERWFTVIAKTENAAIVKHNITGTFAVFRQVWRDENLTSHGMGDEAAAWGHYIKVMNG